MEPATPTTEVLTRDEWLAARLDLLSKEKEFTRREDELSRQIRALPRWRITERYRFTGPGGAVHLEELFGSRRQLAVYHFMLGPGWEEGCKSCSFVSDHFDGMLPHLAARDVAFAAVSHAPWAEIEPFRRRMGWKFPWYSSSGTRFNRDFRVSFTPEEMATGAVHYNYVQQPFPSEEAPGLSIFIRDAAGNVFHTYSSYGRGVERLMGTYRLLDVVPKGRDEAGQDYTMAWVRHHDRYEDTAPSQA